MDALAKVNVYFQKRHKRSDAARWQTSCVSSNPPRFSAQLFVEPLNLVYQATVSAPSKSSAKSFVAQGVLKDINENRLYGAADGSQVIKYVTQDDDVLAKTDSQAGSGGLPTIASNVFSTESSQILVAAGDANAAAAAVSSAFLDDVSPRSKRPTEQCDPPLDEGGEFSQKRFASDELSEGSATIDDDQLIQLTAQALLKGSCAKFHNFKSMLESVISKRWQPIPGQKILTTEVTQGSHSSFHCRMVVRADASSSKSVAAGVEVPVSVESEYVSMLSKKHAINYACKLLAAKLIEEVGLSSTRSSVTSGRSTPSSSRGSAPQLDGLKEDQQNGPGNHAASARKTASASANDSRKQLMPSAATWIRRKIECEAAMGIFTTLPIHRSFGSVHYWSRSPAVHVRQVLETVFQLHYGPSFAFATTERRRPVNQLPTYVFMQARSATDFFEVSTRLAPHFEFITPPLPSRKAAEKALFDIMYKYFASGLIYINEKQQLRWSCSCKLDIPLVLIFFLDEYMRDVAPVLDSLATDPTRFFVVLTELERKAFSSHEEIWATEVRNAIGALKSRLVWNDADSEFLGSDCESSIVSDAGTVREIFCEASLAHMANLNEGNNFKLQFAIQRCQRGAFRFMNNLLCVPDPKSCVNMLLLAADGPVTRGSVKRLATDFVEEHAWDADYAVVSPTAPDA